MLVFDDLHFAVRSLGKTPGFTAAAVLALGLGIGANVSIFSLVDALIIRPLPLLHPENLVDVREDESHLGFPRDTPAPANFVDWKQRNHVFTDMGALQGDIYAITGDGTPEQVEGNPVTANLFPLLGVSPILGRSILPEEDRPGGAKVALISHRLWQQRYGAQAAVIGRDIRLDGVPHRIIGVMPRGFTFPERSDIWVPMGFSSAQLARRDNHYLVVFARLKPGIKITDAQKEMTDIAAQLAREYPATNTRVGAVVISLREELLGDRALALWVLAGGVGCVLLVSCVNLAGLLLARAVGRQREMAVRAALGADKIRLVRQSLAESLAIAAAGGALALMLALWTIPLLRHLVPAVLSGWTPPRIDLRLVAFTALAAVLSTLLFGTLPALTMARVDLAGVLQRGGRTSTSGRSSMRRVLVIAEVALAVVLCVGAGLMVRTVWGLEHVELGFRPEGVLTLRTQLPHSSESPYRSFAARTSFYRGVIERVRAIPGVVSAGYTTFLPLTNRGGTSGFLIEGMPPAPPEERNDANHRVVSQDYLQTIGVHLLAGRFFSNFDGTDSMPVAIINDAMARQYWAGANPLGRRFRFNGDRQPWITIVGVVDNVRQMGLEMAGRAEMYFPANQPAASFGYYAPRDLAVRVQGDHPLRYAEAVRQAIWSVDHNQPVSDVMPLEQLVEADLVSQKTQLWLLSAFAALAMLLSAVGLYGLLSYTVVQQTRDIGVRMALGARQLQVLGEIMRQGLRLVLVGIVAGVTCAWWLSRLLGRLLYGVKPSDPATFSVVIITLALVGCLACFFPSMRAARMDPMAALRDE